MESRLQEDDFLPDRFWADSGIWANMPQGGAQLSGQDAPSWGLFGQASQTPG